MADSMFGGGRVSPSDSAPAGAGLPGCIYCGEEPVVLEGSGLAAHACYRIGRELRMTPATWRSLMGRECIMDAVFAEPCSFDRIQGWMCSECEGVAYAPEGDDAPRFCPHCGAKAGGLR